MSPPHWTILNFAPVCDSVTLIYILYIIVIMLTNKTCGPVGEACIAMSGRTWVRSQVPTKCILLFYLCRSNVILPHTPSIHPQLLATGCPASKIQRASNEGPWYSSKSTMHQIQGWPGLELNGIRISVPHPPALLFTIRPNFISFLFLFPYLIILLNYFFPKINHFKKNIS